MLCSVRMHFPRQGSFNVYFKCKLYKYHICYLVTYLFFLLVDCFRAQSTIKSLDAEISELKISNKDLQIDMEACRKREADKLDLTNKLSAKNAELQSENSILHNKVFIIETWWLLSL